MIEIYFFNRYNLSDSVINYKNNQFIRFKTHTYTRFQSFLFAIKPLVKEICHQDVTLVCHSDEMKSLYIIKKIFRQIQNDKVIVIFF